MVPPGSDLPAGDDFRISGREDSGTPTVIVALAIVWWPGIARMTRSLTLSLRTELFVDAAVVSATRPMRILLRHVLPNTF